MGTLSDFAASCTRRVLAINTDDWCHSKCLHCPYAKEKTRSMPQKEGIFRLVEHFAKNGGELVILAAREPIASPTWEKMSVPLIRLSKKLRLRVGVNLSAHMVREGTEKLKNVGGVDSVSVSIDGVNGVHNCVRGILEEKFFSRIPELCTVAESVSISVTVMRQNLDVLSETISFAVKLSDSLFIATVATTGESDARCHLSTNDFVAVDKKISLLGIGDKALLEITPNSLDVSKLIAQKHLHRFYFRDNLPYVETTTGNEWRILDGVCQFLSGIIRVTADGAIRISYDLETSPIGHVTEPVKTIWGRLHDSAWFEKHLTEEGLRTYTELTELPWK